jgi:hypothetical protein
MSELKTIVVDGVKYVEVREEPVETPKFKVGDIVEIIKRQSDFGFYIGDKVRITSEPDTDGDFKAEYLDGSNWYYVDNSYIKPTADRKKKPLGFEVTINVIESESVDNIAVKIKKAIEAVR